MRAVSIAVAVLAIVVSVRAGEQAERASYRVYASATRAFVNLDQLAADASGADVVLIGDVPGHRAAHEFEYALVEALGRHRQGVIVALEMFDRDAQEILDRFQMRHMSEAAFLAEARAWPGYARDYKPLVDFAIGKSWPIVAANVPRRIAADVAARGLDAIAGRTDADRLFVPASVECPTDDDYHRRVIERLRAEPSDGQAARDSAAVERRYLSHCVEDETIAESIAIIYTAGSLGARRPLVVGLVRDVRVAYDGGTVSRARRRLPQQRVVTVSILPAGEANALTPDTAIPPRADYVVYVAR